MKIRRLREFVACLAVLFSFQTYGQSLPDEQVQKPEVRVGDSWTYNFRNVLPKPMARSYTVTVTFVGPDLLLTANTREGREPEGDGNWTSEWNPRTIGRGVVYLPYAGLLKFPLKVGATYESKYELAGVRGQTGNARFAFESAAKVVGWEEILVPAGKFHALKVEIDSKIRRLDGKGDGWARTVVWWAPEVERWAKTTYADGYPEPRIEESHELAAFKLVSKPK